MGDDNGTAIMGSPHWVVKDHEKRIRALEGHMWKMIGAFLLVAAEIPVALWIMSRLTAKG